MCSAIDSLSQYSRSHSSLLSTLLDLVQSVVTHTHNKYVKRGATVVGKFFHKIISLLLPWNNTVVALLANANAS